MVMSTEPRNPLVLLYCKLSRGSWPDRGMEQPFEDSGEAGLTMAPLNKGDILDGAAYTLNQGPLHGDMCPQADCMSDRTKDGSRMSHLGSVCFLCL